MKIPLHINTRIKSLKVTLFIVSLLALIVSIAAITLVQRQAHAANVTDGFNAGKIIDDTVFTNYKSMTVSQIQSFLNSRVSVCNVNGIEPIPQWVYDYGNKPPFVCLKDYVQDGKKSSQIIYDVAQKYRINPQVLLVLLEKEQWLVSDTWPTQNPQYKSATGYGCPDTAPCDTQYFGLTNQLDWAGKMFRAIMDNVPQSQWYTPYVLGNNYIQYNPDKACGGTVVNIQNRATQALYNYTPYQPNRATLDAGTGTAHCGAYGNRNFYIFFKTWFGDPVQKPSYTWSVESATLYADPARTITISPTGTVEPGQKVYTRVKAKNTGNQTWYRQFIGLATSNPRDRSSKFYDSSTWLSTNRTTRSTETETQSGGIATFDTTLIAPASRGVYEEHFSLVNEGIAWLNDPGMKFTLNVSPSRETSLYSDSNRSIKLGSNKATVYPGDKIYTTVTVRNNTGKTLSPDTRIATTNPNDRLSILRDETWISDNRVVELGQSIPVGETGTFSFVLQAPTTLGVYNESFGMVIDATGGGWIETDTSTLNIQVIEKPLNRLSTETSLSMGDMIKQDTLRLVLQSDGNLVLYHGNRAVWASHTVGTKANRLVLQSDGNLVLYSPTRAVWASHTVGTKANRLVLQSDGNLVLYSPTRAVWASHTNK